MEIYVPIVFEEIVSSSMRLIALTHLTHPALKTLGTIGVSSLVSRSLAASPPLSRIGDSTLSSFAISSLLTNIFKVSSIYDNHIDHIAWSILLPSSLVLSIWSTNPLNEKQNRNSIWKHAPMMASFALGSLGSFVGSYVAAFLSKSNELTAIAGCLCASYIGGTANFFETSSILFPSTSSINISLLHNVAGIDIAIMIIFFVILRRIQSNEHFRRAFPESKGIDSSPQHSCTVDIEQSRMIRQFHSSLVLVVSIFISMSSQVIQRHLQWKGCAIIISTLLAYAASSTFNRLSSSEIQSSLRASSSILSGRFLDLFYSVLGMSFNMTHVVQLGFPVAQLISTILSIHLGVLLLGSQIWNYFVRVIVSSDSKFLIDLDTAILARYES